jgi:hypothetical protein
MREDNLDLNSSFVNEQFSQGAAAEALPVVLPSGTTFVSTINGASGSLTFSGGTTGLTFTPAGATVTVAGTLAIASGGTGAGTVVGARTNLGLGTMATRNAVGAIVDLNQTISATPTQSEVQAISDKIDELLAAMRTASHLTP